MNKLILCEGKTDAILLSYYLEKVSGWKYSSKSPKGLNIKADEVRSESVSWYKNGEDFLLICAVGSKNNFKSFFEQKILRPLIDSTAFSKIALVLDRDDEDTEGIEKTIRSEFAAIAPNAQNGKWIKSEYENGFGERESVDFLLLAIPENEQGALETLLLRTISEDEYDKNIVDRSCCFVDELAPEAKKYIGKRRLQLKAYLGVTWAIMSPQKVFEFIDDQIRMVPWETSELLKECFQELVKI